MKIWNMVLFTVINIINILQMEIILTIVAILCQYKHNGTILKLSTKT